MLGKSKGGYIDMFIGFLVAKCKNNIVINSFTYNIFKYPRYNKKDKHGEY